jgi:RimJ/RimL family protein N-acetyltransferase
MTSDRIVLRILAPADAEDFIELRREALQQEPLMFAASPDDDRALSVSFVQQALRDTSTSATFGAFSPDLIGIIGIRRDRNPKTSHKARLWGFYVSPSYRNSGVGAKLLSTALDFARQLTGVRQLHLSVSDRAEAALQLYKRFGFQTWGVEPNALFRNGEFASEHHMILEL